MTGTRSGRSFKISALPLTSSGEPQSDDPEESLVPGGPPIVLALPRNPRTLFVCWNVDWPATFENALPADRKVYVKLCGRGSQRIHAVEPLTGACSITDLEPGETYSVEIGYYAAPDRWQLVASGHDVVMPLAAAANDETSVEVATVPFHLAFERLTELLGSDENVVQALAQFRQRAVQDSIRSDADEQLLGNLGLSADDLKTAAAMQTKLAKLVPRPSQYGSGGSSWSV